MQRRGVWPWDSKRWCTGLAVNKEAMAINNSPTVKEMQTYSWTKLVLGAKNKEIVCIIKGITYTKVGVNMELQTNEERERCKSVLANKNDPNWIPE